MSAFSLRRWAAFAACAALALGLFAGACGDDDDGGSSAENEELIAAMVSEGATEEEARCFVDELGDDAERLLGTLEEDLSEEDQQTVLEALQECGSVE